jgi:thiaminase
MKYLVRIACFICCVGFHVSAQQNSATPVSPWNSKEVRTFHTILHRISEQYNDCGVLFNASVELETAFYELKHASIPEQSAAAYAAFVDSVRAVLDQFRKAKEAGNCENLKAAFAAIDDTFELELGRLRRVLNGN